MYGNAIILVIQHLASLLKCVVRSKSWSVILLTLPNVSVFTISSKPGLGQLGLMGQTQPTIVFINKVVLEQSLFFSHCLFPAPTTELSLF